MTWPKHMPINLENEMSEEEKCITNTTSKGFLNRSESINEIATALAKAQAVMRGATKDSTNPYFSSKYADLASVWEACREALTQNEISVIQPTMPSEKDEILLETILMHSSGQWVSSITQIPVAKADAQGFGSALTYARRYGLSSMAGIAPEDDDGNAAAAAKPHPKAASKPINPTTDLWEELTDKQRQRLTDLSLAVTDYLDMGDIDAALAELSAAELPQEEKAAIWTRFNSKQREMMAPRKSR